ncbi:MAG: glycosyltransferase [Desulforhabdus sp.]|nr:glycosyltransferase [Desulforhabdus sp.]
MVVNEKKHLAQIDAAVVVSTAQMDFFATLLGPHKVYYVPHGIDVDYFKPKDINNPTDDGALRCLFVGTHMRDFTTLAETWRILNKAAKAYRLDVVTSSKYQHCFKGIKDTHLHFGISDQKLLDLYQHADAFVLPLSDCTANNSLLEAMSCGLPIICTDLPGARDYVNDTCTLFVPKADAKAFAEAIASLHADKKCRQRMAISSRALSLDFSWRKVSSKIQEVYQHVVANQLGRSGA